MQDSFNIQRTHNTLAAVVTACMLLGCNATATDHLMRIPVDSSESIPPDEANKQLAALDTSRDEYSSPLSVATLLWHQPSAGTSAVAATRVGDSNSYKAIVILDAVPGDDSVSGWRYDLRLTKTEADKWAVSDLRRSWRCWDGRGHRNFSTEPCT
jgi:hypothetical protein